VLLILPFYSFSQEIKSNILDGFTNDRTIETTIETLKSGFSTGFGVSYTAVNNVYYLNIVGYGKSNTAISEDDKVWFVLEDGSVVQFNSRVEMDYGSEYQNIFIHHYYINPVDIEVLSKKKLKIVRIVSPARQTDVKVSNANGKGLMKLSSVFLQEVSK